MTTQTTQDAPSQSSVRKPLLIGLAVIFLLAAVAYAFWWMSVGRYIEKTDDAYVAGNVVQITPQAAGTVVAILADDTEYVKAGQPLVLLDKADARIALEQAEAALGQTVRETRSLFTGQATFQANIALRESELAKARDDVRRRIGLAGSGAVSAEEIRHAEDTVKTAEAALSAAKEQLASSHALVANTTIEKHPAVTRAIARLEEAQLALERTTIPAPVDGYIAKRSVQVGQRINVGAPLMAVIPLDHLWVDGNFKESQLKFMRLGQPVILHADVFGSDIDYHGKIVGLSAGTGAAFSLLPAQNATGNWIKVVQRLPVRISLDQKELSEHPLRVGLSMQADVDVKDHSGPQLAGALVDGPVSRTRVFDTTPDAQAARSAKIVADHVGG